MYTMLAWDELKTQSPSQDSNPWLSKELLSVPTLRYREKECSFRKLRATIKQLLFPLVDKSVGNTNTFINYVDSRLQYIHLNWG